MVSFEKMDGLDFYGPNLHILNFVEDREVLMNCNMWVWAVMIGKIMWHSIVNCLTFSLFCHVTTVMPLEVRDDQLYT